MAWPLAAADTVGSSSSDDAGATTSLQAPQAQQLQFNFCAGGGCAARSIEVGEVSDCGCIAGLCHSAAFLVLLWSCWVSN